MVNNSSLINILTYATLYDIHYTLHYYVFWITVLYYRYFDWIDFSYIYLN